MARPCSRLDVASWGTGVEANSGLPPPGWAEGRLWVRMDETRMVVGPVSTPGHDSGHLATVVPRQVLQGEPAAHRASWLGKSRNTGRCRVWSRICCVRWSPRLSLVVTDLAVDDLDRAGGRHGSVRRSRCTGCWTLTIRVPLVLIQVGYAGVRTPVECGLMADSGVGVHGLWTGTRLRLVSCGMRRGRRGRPRIRPGRCTRVAA